MAWSRLVAQRQRLRGSIWLPGLCGLLIGAGGFNEISVAGMGIWALIQFDKKKFLSGPPTFRDLTVISIGMLMLAYWQFQDPYLPSTFNGLTLVEAGKAGAWWLFSLTFFRCSKPRDRKILLLGVAAGLFTYAGATALGSLIYQGPGGGYVQIYNIYDGSTLANSTTCGYAASGALLMATRLKKNLFIPAAITTVAVGLQSGARTPIAVALFLTCYYGITALISSQKNWRERFKTAILALLVISFSAGSGMLRIPAISRLASIAKPEGRAILYPEGIWRLTSALRHGDPSILGNPTSLYIFEQWWHNILLDSYRNAGLAGLALATAWALNLASTSLIGLLSNDYLLTLISIATSFLLFTGLPLGTGAHELISVLALTLLCNLRVSELRPQLQPLDRAEQTPA